MPMKNPPHPGLSVRHDCLEPLGLTVTEAAQKLGVSRKQLSNVVNGRSGISPEMAIRLDMVFGGGAATWVPDAGGIRPGPGPRQGRHNRSRTSRAEDSVRGRRPRPWRPRDLPQRTRLMSIAYVDSSVIVGIAFQDPGWAAAERRLADFSDLRSSNLLEAEAEPPTHEWGWSSTSASSPVSGGSFRIGL